MELLGEGGSGLTLEELSKSSGIPKSSLHRTLGALKHRGFASQNEDSGRYFLGNQMLRIAFGFHDHMDVRALVRPLLVRLRDEFNETVHMGVLDGTHVVYLDKVESSHPLKMTSVIGGRNPAHCTGLGKALLAWAYPSDEAARLWHRASGPFTRRTRNSITSERRFVEEMAAVRSRGYALDLEESEYGVRCVGVPVFIGQPAPAAAISLATPAERLSKAKMEKVAPRLLRMVGSEFPPYPAGPLASRPTRDQPPA